MIHNEDGWDLRSHLCNLKLHIRTRVTHRVAQEQPPHKRVPSQFSAWLAKKSLRWYYQSWQRDIRKLCPFCMPPLFTTPPSRRKPIASSNAFTIFILAFLLLFAFGWWQARCRSSSSDLSYLQNPNLRDPSLPPAWVNTTRVKAAFVILTRNSELEGVRTAMWQLEARFNSKFNYPYIFLNDEPFTDEFKRLTTSLTNAETKYGILENIIRKLSISSFSNTDLVWIFVVFSFEAWYRKSIGVILVGLMWKRPTHLAKQWKKLVSFTVVVFRIVTCAGKV